MRRLILASLAAAMVLPAAAPDFSGTWIFDASKSRGAGMMAGLKATLTIKQTPDTMSITTVSKFNDQEQTRETRYDLTGKPVSNESAMGGKSETISRWEANQLVTTWTAEGAIAGTKVVRTETRSVSPDGKTMSVETVRGTNPPVVMVYDRK